MKRVLSRLRRQRLNRAMHELRRPLQVLTLLLDRDPANDDARACLGALRSALEEMDDAVNSRVPVFRRVRIDPADLVAGVEARWRGVASVRSLAAGPLPPSRPSLIGDPAALGRAIDNLVANALEHGSGPVDVALAADSEHVLFEVRDQGGSVPSSLLASSDPNRGHGLAIVAEVAERHGGSATLVRSETGGTTAALSLPAWAEA